VRIILIKIKFEGKRKNTHKPLKLVFLDKKDGNVDESLFLYESIDAFDKKLYLNGEVEDSSV